MNCSVYISYVTINGKLYQVRPGDDYTLVNVQLKVVEAFGITNEQFHAKIKTEQVNMARKCFCWICCRLYQLSYKRVSKYMGRHDHLHARNHTLTMDMWIKLEYPIIQKLIEVIEQL